MSTVTAPLAAAALVRVPQPKRWTVAEFHKLFGEPTFRNNQFILIEGEILEMPAPNPPHDVALGLTDQVLRAAFGAAYWVRGQMSLILGLSTDPMPDLAIVRGSPRDYCTTHPRSAELVVEIADSSLSYDTREKANIYAAGGIAEYWVVDLVHRQLHVFRDPTMDASQAFGAYYRSRQSLDVSAKILPLAVTTNEVAVSALLP